MPIRQPARADTLSATRVMTPGIDFVRRHVLAAKPVIYMTGDNAIAQLSPLATPLERPAYPYAQEARQVDQLAGMEGRYCNSPTDTWDYTWRGLFRLGPTSLATGGRVIRDRPLSRDPETVQLARAFLVVGVKGLEC